MNVSAKIVDGALDDERAGRDRIRRMNSNDYEKFQQRYSMNWLMSLAALDGLCFAEFVRIE
jgi:hypothetical protein